MSDDGFDRSVAMLRAGRRWQTAGGDDRQGEYVRGGEEVWFDGGDFVSRSWSTHGWGGGPPTDAHENVERWDEAKLRERLAGAMIGYPWDDAPLGASIVPAEFDPELPMPGFVARPAPVTPEDVDRAVGHLGRGYTFEYSCTERRGASEVWGRERVARRPYRETFTRTRCWAFASGDGDVRARYDEWTEAELRAFLLARPDVVHWDRWPQG